jgi:ATP-dependent DNA helicase RecG
MILHDLLSQVSFGEGSYHRFKQNITNVDLQAVEMEVFANAEGSIIFLGVTDDGSIPGVTSTYVSLINQIIRNSASYHKKPHDEDQKYLHRDERIVNVLIISKEQDKPHRSLDPAQ